MKLIKFTKQGLDKLKLEVEELNRLRPAAVKELSRAREMGDLSENGLYHAAKANLRSIDSRLRRFSVQIKLAQIVPSRKYLVEQDGQKKEYEIVGDFEADPAKNKISANSPIAQAIIGGKAGESIQIQTPSGIRVLKILQVL